MQIAIMLIFFVVWLLILWLGSIALEATGLERTKARFQTLSALTGTGFTTTEAESIVNHPRRRRIATWLIFIGNAGVITFIITLILLVRAGIGALSPQLIGIIIITFLVLGLLVGLKIIDKLTGAILRLIRRGRAASLLQTEEILHQIGDYAVARLILSEKSVALKDTGITEHGITILALKRGDTVLALPGAEEPVMAGDHLLCFGKASAIMTRTQ
jgi:hypothetical protein